MIAKNYMKHPEALRFQRELFSNGFHNSPRIMRLMECIFDWTPSAPDWWTAAKAKARALAKAVKKSIIGLFETSPEQLTAQRKKALQTATGYRAHVLRIQLSSSSTLAHEGHHLKVGLLH